MSTRKHIFDDTLKNNITLETDKSKVDTNLLNECIKALLTK